MTRRQSTSKLIGLSLVAVLSAVSTAHAQPAAGAPPKAPSVTAAPAAPGQPVAPAAPPPAIAPVATPPAAAPPAAPGAGAAPPQEAPPSETPPPVERLPADAPAAAVTPTAQVALPEASVAPAPEPNDLLPPGDKEQFESKPTTLEFKPGRGFSMKSANGDFELTTRARAQFLYTILNDGVADTTKESLEIRRFRLTMQGAAFGVHNRFYLELGFGPRENVPVAGTPSTAPLVDAYAEFDYLRDLTLRVGQYKPSYGRQRVISDGNLQFVDVSIVTRDFTFDRDVGFDFRSKDFLGLNALRYVVGIYSGRGKNAFDPTEFKMLYLGRVELLPFGTFEDYQESDLDRTKPRLSIGATLAHFTGAPRDGGSVGTIPLDGGTTDMNHFEADALFKAYGFSLQSEFFYRHGDRNIGTAKTAMGAAIPAAPSRDGIGWYGQAGYLIPRAPFEIAARYGLYRNRDAEFHNGLKDMNEIGGGLSYYFARHCLKLQSDFFRVYESGNAENGSNQFRLQLQVAL